MCGIFGAIGKIEREVGEACLGALSHRGPDGSGVFHQGEVFLGHQRLAILDLSDAAAQPMAYLGGRYQIIFNGEIYNFVELRQELLQLGYQFKTDSDTEVLVAAFDAWQEQCLDRFNGMWAFAIWDSQQESLFLSRDRFGQKPLYILEQEHRFVFASEMTALYPLISEPTINEALLGDKAHYFYYESTEECLIKEVRRFPAGHYAVVRPNQPMQTVRYWCTLDHLVEVPDTYEAQVAHFRELFIDSCRLRMRADVPIGTALSGGLDSSAVSCVLSYISKQVDIPVRAARQWQHGFTASFPGSPIDEVEWAQKVADYVRMNLTVILVDPAKYIETLYRDIYIFGDVYITPLIPFVATYRAMRDNGVVVTLDGHGADELFGGYAFDYLHALYDQPFNIPKAKTVIDTYYATQINDDSQFQKLPPKWLFWFKQFTKNIAKRLLRYRNTHPDDQHEKWKTLDYFTQKLYISFHQTVLPTLLRNYDRYSMMSGVEVRMPFLDHRLVAYAFSLPWNTKIRGGYTKAIIRDALREYMPEEVVNRKTKIGFNAPMVEWFRGPMKSFFEELLAGAEQPGGQLPQAAETKLRNVLSGEVVTFHQAEDAWREISPWLWRKSFELYKPKSK